jgi:putative nucleotidyltransferase with HDIG domain
MTGVLAEAQALERRGQRDEARRLYEQALYSGAAIDAAAAAQALRWVARTYLLDADFAAAEDAAEAALAVSEQASDEPGRGHAINMLASVRLAQGNLDEAQRLFVEARASAQASGEARLAAMTATNLGTIASVRGNEKDALRFHESGLADARGAGLADQAMHALNNLGMLHTQMGKYLLAERAYSEALEIGTVLGDLSVRIVVELNMARLRIRQGDHLLARQACDRATSLAKQTGNAQSEGEAEHIFGIIARAGGDDLRAEQHFLLAEGIASRRQDLILQGETARELAELYRRQGRNRETLQKLNQAHRHFAQLRARRELADVDRRTALLESEFLDVARRWGDSIESKDLYTQGHCIRVADLACALWARVSEGDDTSLFWFRIGALLHDVGKLMIPAEVLNKPSRLTDAEWALIRRHPSAGVELLADIEFPWDVRPIVESHHERWDGKGYPHGLAGEAIPLTARVLCVADVYDALTSQRSYKKAFTHDEAIEIMRADVGRQFDPTLFAEFEEVLRSDAWRSEAVSVA